MQVFMMRHGEAESMAESDSFRQLAAEGREDVLQMVSTYREELSQVDVIWASPYIRAQQTAHIASEALSKPVLTQDFLPPSGNPREVLDALAKHQEQTVLLVTHQPLVGILVDGLAGLEPGRYRMGTGALAHIRTDIYENDCGSLEWLHQPASVCP